MQSIYLVAIDEFCSNHKIESSFIWSLQQNGLIEITLIRETGFIDLKQLRQLERIVRMYYEMDINLEGIETINYLLEKINSLQDEILLLRNRLRLYETETLP